MKSPRPTAKASLEYLRSLGQPSRFEASELVLVGQLAKPHGLGGEMRCRPETDYPERFLDTEELEIFFPEAPPRRVPLQSARIHKGLVLVHLLGVDDVDQAELLREARVAVGPDEVVDLEEGEYYHYQLEGLRVEDPQGCFLGRISQVLSLPAHEVYCIQGDQGEILVPAVAEYVIAVNLKQGLVVVRPPVFADED